MLTRCLRSCILTLIVILVLLWAFASWGYGVIKGLYERFVADQAEAEAASQGRSLVKIDGGSQVVVINGRSKSEEKSI